MMTHPIEEDEMFPVHNGKQKRIENIDFEISENKENLESPE